jgi:hypothetical protein
MKIEECLTLSRTYRDLAYSIIRVNIGTSFLSLYLLLTTRGSSSSSLRAATSTFLFSLCPSTATGDITRILFLSLIMMIMVFTSIDYSIGVTTSQNEYRPRPAKMNIDQPKMQNYNNVNNRNEKTLSSNKIGINYKPLPPHQKLNEANHRCRHYRPHPLPLHNQRHRCNPLLTSLPFFSSYPHPPLHQRTYQYRSQARLQS